MGLFDTKKIKLKNDIRKLDNARRDLSDDTSSIQEINRYIDQAESNVQSFLGSGGSKIASRLENYKEPFQFNDSSLRTAAEYIGYEITILDKQLKGIENAEREASGKAGGGGGGAAW